MSTIEEVVLGHITSELEKKTKGIAQKVTEDVVKRVVEELHHARPVEIIVGDKAQVMEGLTHHKFEEILSYMSARISLILVGPAGSGKTHIAFQCAEALGLDKFSISVNEQTSKADFMGYVDANGKLVRTNFRNAYENGGVFIVDEIDCGNPNILTIINSALSNDWCPFPDGMVKRHEKFMCVCTANTFGEGESVQYVGRNVLDSATKDRFATLFVSYDKNIENSIDMKWVGLVRELRDYFTKNNTNFVVSTRGLIRLTSLSRAKAKMTEEDIKNCLNLHTGYDLSVGTIVRKYLK